MSRSQDTSPWSLRRVLGSVRGGNLAASQANLSSFSLAAALEAERPAAMPGQGRRRGHAAASSRARSSHKTWAGKASDGRQWGSPGKRCPLAEVAVFVNHLFWQGSQRGGTDTGLLCKRALSFYTVTSKTHPSYLCNEVFTSTKVREPSQSRRTKLLILSLCKEFLPIL